MKPQYEAMATQVFCLFAQLMKLFEKLWHRIENCACIHPCAGNITAQKIAEKTCCMKFKELHEQG